VKSGRLPANVGKFFSNLFDLRQEADYKHSAFEKDAVRKLSQEAQEFVRAVSVRVEKYLAEKEDK